ncbi:hypothetical protein CLV51_102781 [Chitinophaga niastensis]|uniref:ABC-2 family transporter n=1 Tax=Chitinophaga niastensis TaxID=536980 RepID=A0A2P8HNY4_CHINA|nr:ABC transporter permease [Chitinophaga niastensis]PSL47921.1 hypothetical protein CLV51_102781 [Chitinophaga niastensis]
MNRSFLLNTSAEFLKCRKTVVIWLTILVAALLPPLNYFMLMEHRERFIQMMKRDPWDLIFMINLDNAATVTLPVFCILLSATIASIEIRNNTWKQVYSQPRSHADIYFSKFIVVQYYLLLYFICSFISSLTEGFLLHAMDAAFPLYWQNIHWQLLLTHFLRIYIGALALSTLQYWLSIHLRNFIVPVFIGLGLLAAGSVVNMLGYGLYYPYVYPRIMLAINIVGNRYNHAEGTAFTYCLGGFLLLLMPGFVPRRKII